MLILPRQLHPGKHTQEGIEQLLQLRLTFAGQLTLVTSLSIENSWVQCLRSQPVPLTNFRYGRHRLHVWYCWPQHASQMHNTAGHCTHAEVHLRCEHCMIENKSDTAGACQAAPLVKLMSASKSCKQIAQNKISLQELTPQGYIQVSSGPTLDRAVCLLLRLSCLNCLGSKMHGS